MGITAVFLFQLYRTQCAEIAVIAAIDEENSQTGLIDVLGDICKETRKILEVPITIGIGHGRQELGDDQRVPTRRPWMPLDIRPLWEAGSTIYINDVEPVSGGKLQFDGKDEAELIAAIKFGPREKIEDQYRIMDKMSDAKVHFRQCQAYMLSVSSSIVQLIQQYDLDMEQLLEGGVRQGGYLCPHTQDAEKGGFCQWLLSARPAHEPGDEPGT